MSDFNFLKDLLNDRWVVSAPRRSHRTNVEQEASICPFCPGQEIPDEELYKVGEGNDWRIRVIKNKFPFAPNHEVIIHSPDHHKSFDELPLASVELILRTYKERFNTHASAGQVYIFNNSGDAAGASLPHPHTQLVVIPHENQLNIPAMDMKIYEKLQYGDENILETENFLIFCPQTSEWPDEVWLAPKEKDRTFGQISDVEVSDMALVLSRVIQILDTRHGHEFPFNFYIYPGKNWYLRLIPKIKILGGFELGTGVMVNTQDPKETFAFLKEHFREPNHEKIQKEHKADYKKSA